MDSKTYHERTFAVVPVKVPLYFNLERYIEAGSEKGKCYVHICGFHFFPEKP